MKNTYELLSEIFYRLGGPSEHQVQYEGRDFDSLLHDLAREINDKGPANHVIGFH